MSVAAIALVVSLIVFMAIGIPITFSLGMSSLLAIALSKPLSITLIVTKIFAGADSFPILAVIYFMIAGELMLQGGLTKRLVALFRKLLGWIPGSMVGDFLHYLCVFRGDFWFCPGNDGGNRKRHVS